MKTIKYLVPVLLLNFSLFAQFTEEWVKTYNGTGNGSEEAIAIKLDASSNVYVAGRVISSGNNSDIGIVKYNSAGVQQWAAAYNGPANDYDEAAGIALDHAGNIYAAGITNTGNGSYNIVTLKYNSSGIQQWAQVWNGPSNFDDFAAGIYSDSAGNVYVTGYTEVTSSLNYNYITIKYNSAGALQWAKQYNNPVNSSDIAYLVTGDPSGNVYVTGTSVAQETGVDMLTVKYNPDGDSLWTARYSGTDAINEIPAGIKADAQGNVYVTCRTQGTGSGTDFMTVKYNSAGVSLWQTRYTSPGNSQDIPEDLAIDNSGNVYVTGRTRINSSYNDFATIKYNSAGVEQWMTPYNYEGVDRDDYGYGIIVDAQGNVYVTGNSQASGTNRDAITIKYNSSGAMQWTARYDAANSEETYGIALDAAGNVYVTGYRSGTNQDFLTIKYSQANGITQVSNEIPGNYSLSQNYPNPFNPVTNIEFSVPKSADVKITVYDILGRENAVLVNEKLQAGIYKIDFNARRLASGIYFYTITAGEYNETKKMILVR